MHADFNELLHLTNWKEAWPQEERGEEIEGAGREGGEARGEVGEKEEAEGGRVISIIYIVDFPYRQKYNRIYSFVI